MIWYNKQAKFWWLLYITLDIPRIREIVNVTNSTSICSAIKLSLQPAIWHILNPASPYSHKMIVYICYNILLGASIHIFYWSSWISSDGSILSRIDIPSFSPLQILLAPPSVLPLSLLSVSFASSLFPSVDELSSQTPHAILTPTCITRFGNCHKQRNWQPSQVAVPTTPAPPPPFNPREVPADRHQTK